jgi:hypothetical protein
LGSSFLFPRPVDSAVAGPEGAKNLAGEDVLRLIQIRLTTLKFGKNLVSLLSQFAASANRQFKFAKRSQLFIRTHNETLLGAAMRVGNEDRSPARIHG